MPFPKGSNKNNQKSKGKSQPKSARIQRDQQHKGKKRGGKLNPEPPKRVKMSVATEVEGLTDKNRRIYLATAFVYRYKEPARSDWEPYVKELVKEVQCDRRTVISLWEDIVETKDIEYAVEAEARSGRPPKLSPDNPGLMAAAAAINMGVSPQQATELCNAVNDQRMEKPVTICRNTMVRTLKKYTTVLCQSVLHRKTGSRDEESAWAKARVASCTRVLVLRVSIILVIFTHMNQKKLI